MDYINIGISYNDNLLQWHILYADYSMLVYGVIIIDTVDCLVELFYGLFVDEPRFRQYWNSSNIYQRIITKN